MNRNQSFRAGVCWISWSARFRQYPASGCGVGLHFFAFGFHGITSRVWISGIVEEEVPDECMDRLFDRDCGGAVSCDGVLFSVACNGGSIDDSLCSFDGRPCRVALSLTTSHSRKTIYSSRLPSKESIRELITKATQDSEALLRQHPELLL